jgi:site-specific recombinase XerD
LIKQGGERMTMEISDKLEKWFEEMHGSTLYVYKTAIKKFFEETGLQPVDMEKLEPLEIKHILLKWYNETEKKYSRNTRLTVVTAVRSFCSSDYINKPLRFKRKQIGKRERDKKSHIWQTNELKQMFTVADTFEKAILATALSCGYEVSSFCSLPRQQIKNMIEQAKANDQKYIFWQDDRDKTEEPRLLVLNPLAIEWLTKYLETNQDKSEKLLMITEKRANRILAKLAKDANIQLTGRVRFHRLRVFTETMLSKTDIFNSYEISYILGHVIEGVNGHYLLELKNNIEEKYPRAYENTSYLNIMGNGNNGETKRRVSELEEQVRQLTEVNKALKEENEQLKQSVSSVDAKNTTLEQRLTAIEEYIKKEQK